MAIVGASGELRLFEPPTKPRDSMKKLKASHEKTIADMKFKHRLAVRFLRDDIKGDVAAAKAEKKSADVIAKIKTDGAAALAEKKEAFKKLLEETLAAQKQEVAEKKVSYEESYKVDIALWKKEPEISKEEAAALKVDLDAKKAELQAKLAEVKAAHKAALAEAKAEPAASARKLAIAKVNEKFNNMKLDVGEEKRVAVEKYERAVYSEAKYYSIHQRQKNFAAIWRDKALLLMLIPFLLFFGIFHYGPMPGIQIAFKDYSIRKGIWASEWVGLKNFESFLGGPYFLRLLRNTFVINLYGLILGFPASPIFALLLNELRSKLFKTTVQTISYLPHFVSSVVIAGIVVNFLAPSGLFNHIYIAVKSFFTQESVDPIYFLMKPEYFRMIYTLMGIWSGFGFGSIVYSSAISGVDQELYEAAKIDGAGRWRQAISITLPSIMPTIAIYLIMRIGHMLSVGYETIILLYQPVTYETADVISTYSYRMGLGSTSGRPDYSLSAAIGLFNAVVSFTLVSITNKISNKLGDVGLW